MHGAYDYISATFATEMFAKDEKFHTDYRELPDHLQIDHEGSTNPWHNSFMQDFIMVAEFSEHEGPRPLFTIPEDAGEIFDKNAFAVHVMSVDYQTQTSNFFSLVDDTQLIFSEDRENIYAYVHHYILYDIEARGFVRPFCMCYISNSKKKILTNLERFIQEFNKISKQFKNANISSFHADLMERSSDLIYVKDCLKGIECGQSERIEFPKNSSNLQGLTKETIDSMLMDTNKAIKALKESELNSTGRQSYSEENVTEPLNRQNSIENQDHDVIIQRVLRERRRHLLTLRDIDTLCGYRAGDGLDSLQKLHRNFYQSFEVFSLIMEETTQLDPFSSVLTIGGSFVMNFQRNIPLTSSKPIPCATRSTTNPFTMNSYDSARSEMSVESYKSCADDDESSSEVLPNDGELSVYSPFCKVTTKDLLGRNNSAESTTDPNETATLRSRAGSISEHSRQSLENSQDYSDENTSIESSSTTVDVVLCERISAAGGVSPRPHRASTGDLTSLGNKLPKPIQRQLSAIETQSSFIKALSNHIPVPSTQPVFLRTDMPSSWTAIEHFAAGRTPQYTVVYKDITHNSDIISKGSSTIDRFDRLFVQCYAQQLGRRKADGPGGGILRVLRDHGYLVHLLYALLRGRTIVIIGEPSHQRDVQALVTALWLFVPGHFRGFQQVVLWRTKPFKLVDLQRFKLVGLCKSKQFNVLPNSVETHVTILDFETGCLKTPRYQGEFLNEMLASRRSWKNDSMFLANIHSIYLEMSLKAFVCYFATSLGTSSGNEQENFTWKNQYLVSRNFSAEYMTDIVDKLGILGSDAHIIMYFLDLITQQRIADVSSTLHISGNHSLDSSSLSSTASFDHSGGSYVVKSRPVMLDFTQRSCYRKSSE